MRRRAFTVIELLLSISIGGAICATAFVAMRVTTQSVSAADRLSVENQLMRSGVCGALDELDSWNWYDDPAPGGDQPLRLDKHPFNPLVQTEDFNFEYSPVRDPTLSYEEWWRRDSRTWFRSDPNCGVYAVGDHGLGDYSLFGKDSYADGSALGGAEKRWRHLLCKNLSRHEGYFALIDYAPASLLYHFYTDEVRWGSLQTGVSDLEFLNAVNGGIGSMWTTAWAENKAHDFVCLTTGNFFTVTVPARATDPKYQVDDINRSVFLTWYNYDTGGAANAGWSVDDAYRHCGGRLGVLPVKPANWPELQATVRHYASNARQFHTGTVLIRSPITAQTFKVYFSYTGTTLRGARRNRALDGSWP